MRLRRKKRVVLILGAGGSRGLAHIGVLRALKEEDIAVDFIAGISFGAIIGAMYSLYLDVNEVEKRLRDYMESPLFQETRREMELPEPDKATTFLEKIQSTIKQGYFFTRALSRKSFVTPETFVLHMKELVGEHTFADPVQVFQRRSYHRRSHHFYGRKPLPGAPGQLCDTGILRPGEHARHAPGGWRRCRDGTLLPGEDLQS